MSVSTEINELESAVQECLQKDYRLRDSDKKLCARIWTIQLGGLNELKAMSAYDFFIKYTDDSNPLYSQESIGRCRRKLQEENPLLRGSKWAERHAEQENVVNEIRQMEK